MKSSKNSLALDLEITLTLLRIPGRTTPIKNRSWEKKVTETLGLWGCFGSCKHAWEIIGNYHNRGLGILFSIGKKINSQQNSNKNGSSPFFNKAGCRYDRGLREKPPKYGVCFFAPPISQTNNAHFEDIGFFLLSWNEPAWPGWQLTQAGWASAKFIQIKIMWITRQVGFSKFQFHVSSFDFDPLCQRGYMFAFPPHFGRSRSASSIKVK